MSQLRSSEIFGLKSISEQEYFSSIRDVDKYAEFGQAHYMRRAFIYYRNTEYGQKDK